MGWEDIEEMPTIGLRDELLTLLDKELEYGLPPPGGGVSSSPPRTPPRAQQPSLSSPPPPSSSCGGGEVGGDGNNTVLSAYEEMRRNVCQWNYECVDYFLFDREVVYYSMHYYDRYHNNNMNPSTSASTSQQQQQPSTTVNHLLAISSLYLACKIHGTAAAMDNNNDTNSNEDVLSSFTPSSSRRRIGLQQFCIMSRGAYCPQMLEEMEVSVLTTLQWKLHPPSPTDFLIRYVKILSLLLKDDIIIVYAATNHQQQPPTHSDNVGKGWSVFEVARYQLELAVYSSELCHNVLPSKIAFAAILNALDSRVVRTKKTIVSSRIRHAFLQHIKCLGGGYAELNVQGEDIVEARTTLKKLCSKTIVLPGQIVDDHHPLPSNSFTPIVPSEKSFEYELPEVHSVSGSSTSPVSVATDHF